MIATHHRLVLLSVAVAGLMVGLAPSAAFAYVECGNPAGPARNVTAVAVSCSDARKFAAAVARRKLTHSQSVTLPGWRAYEASIRRVPGGYDVRATRDAKVIRFQYLSGGSDSVPADYLTMDKAEAVARARARELADPGETHGVDSCERLSSRRVDCGIYSHDALEEMECTATVTVVKEREYGRWHVNDNVRGIDCHSG